MPSYGLNLMTGIAFRQPTRWYITNNVQIESIDTPNIEGWTIVGNLNGYASKIEAKAERAKMYRYETENGTQTFTIGGKNWRT